MYAGHTLDEWFRIEKWTAMLSTVHLCEMMIPVFNEIQ